MARRTKREMELMNHEAKCYLLQTNNDPHKAFELMVKECLEAHESIPYFMKDIKDFIKVSQELAVEWNRKEQMKKADKERFENKETIMNYILQLTKEDAYEIYKQYKDKVSHSDKLVLVDVYNMIAYEDMQKKYIDQQTINVFSKIYNEQLLPV
jgi:Cu/Ag efflux pump CusA